MGLQNMWDKHPTSSGDGFPVKLGNEIPANLRSGILTGLGFVFLTGAELGSKPLSGLENASAGGPESEILTSLKKIP